MKKLIILLLITNHIFALNLNKSEFRDLIVKNHPQFNELELIKRNKIIARDINDPFVGYSFSSSIGYLSNDGDHNASQDYESKTLTNIISSNNEDGSVTSLNQQIINRSGSFDNDIKLSHKIPLRQNKDGVNDKLGYDIAVININVNNIEDLIARENFINTNTKKLINLRYYIDRLAILEEKNLLDREQLSLIVNRFNNNLVDATDVLSQQSSIKANELDILRTQQEIANLRENIKKLIKVDNFVVDIDLNKLEQIKNVTFSQLANINLLKLRQQVLYRELTSLKNSELNEVDLTLTAGVSGDNEHLSDALANFGTNFGVSLDVTFPFKNDVSNKRVREKYNEIKIKDAQIATQSIDNKNNINNIVNNIENTKNIVSLIKQQIVLNEESYDEYEKLYRDNNTEFNFVLSAKDKLLNSRLELLNALRDYHILVIDYNNNAINFIDDTF